jgi:hypothetical protein
VASWFEKRKPKMHLVRCPVHGQRVVMDGKGRVVGCCIECMAEATDALYRLAQAAS